MGYSTTYIKNGKVESLGGNVSTSNFPNGDYEGQVIKKYWENRRGTARRTDYYQWNGSTWESISDKEGALAYAAQVAAAPGELEKQGYGGLGGISPKPLGPVNKGIKSIQKIN